MIDFLFGVLLLTITGFAFLTLAAYAKLVYEFFNEDYHDYENY